MIRIFGYFFPTVSANLSFLESLLMLNHSNDSRAVLSCGPVYYAVQGGSSFSSMWMKWLEWPFKWKLLKSPLPLCRLSAVQGGYNTREKNLKEFKSIAERYL